jgi:hypothetical protein
MERRLPVNSYKFSILLASLITVFIHGFGESKVQAQTLGITPAFVEAKVKRGATYNKDFTITNNTKTRLRFRFSVADYWYNETNQRIDGRPGTLPHSASLWVQFSPKEIIVEANSSATIKAIISVPLTASGGYYTRPVFEAEDADAPVRQQGVATASVGINFRGLMMLTTEDNAEYNVEVLGGQVTPPTASSPMDLSLDLNNRSTSHATMRGIFAIFKASGELIGRGKLEEKRFLPGERDKLKTAWAGELSPGRYTAMVTLSYNRVGQEPASMTYELSFEVK